MTTLSLEASKKVYELCGEFETEKHHMIAFPGNLAAHEPFDIRGWEQDRIDQWQEAIPAYNFAELIRLLPKIEEALALDQQDPETTEGMTISEMMVLSRAYMNAPTEPEGMAAVESYLISIL